jgi:histidinol-phosphatase (PHP family)
MVFFITMRDYHLHTSLCKHAVGEMEEYVLMSIERGMTEICFTDHIPLPGDLDPDHRMGHDEVEPYLEQIALLNRKYKEISILRGIEVDYIEGLETYIENFLKTHRFDMVIMGVHFIEQWEGEQWVFNFDYTEETLPRQYKDYFDALYKGIKTGLFDVLAHLDLVKRPGYPVMRTNRDDVENILDEVKRQDMSIEFNTSGLRKPINETYPSMEILKLAVKKGIPITMSSDSHRPEHVGYAFDYWLNRFFNIENLKLARYRDRKCTVSLLGQSN